MANPYSGEWIKINTIANDVRALQDRIAELQNAAAQLQADINSVPEVTDEEGNDVNAEQRNALNAQLESVKASIDEANGQRERLGSQARALARQYQTEARAYEEKARHTSNATAVFNNISNYRFGARMASANAQVTKQREQHYQSYVNILNALVIAAQNAANGITPSGSEQSVADRGTFHNSHSTSGGAHKSGEKGNRQNYQRGWNGIPGESQKIADQNESKALLNNLGVEGIPYKNGQPDFSTVAHAAVPTDDSAALLTCADAMLAAKYGVSADEIAAYRKENGLEWRGNENGEATLIPQCIGDEYLEGRVENQEKSAKDALTAYMWAHNYGKDDYDEYSKDPEWQKLHREAFPLYYGSRPQVDHQLADHEISKEEKLSWVRDMVPEESMEESKKIVSAIEHYTGEGYSDIHNDRENAREEIESILRVLDSPYVPVYKGDIHRGLSFSSAADLANVLSNSKGVWQEPGITSYSSNIEIAKEFASQDEWGLVLTCRNNKSAIPIKHMSINSREDEVLSPGNARDIKWVIDYKTLWIDKENRKVKVYVDIYETGR